MSTTKKKFSPKNITLLTIEEADFTNKKQRIKR